VLETVVPPPSPTESHFGSLGIGNLSEIACFEQFAKNAYLVNGGIARTGACEASSSAGRTLALRGLVYSRGLSLRLTSNLLSPGG
jgi:hypothetical protein